MLSVIVPTIVGLTVNILNIRSVPPLDHAEVPAKSVARQTAQRVITVVPVAMKVYCVRSVTGTFVFSKINSLLCWS